MNQWDGSWSGTRRPAVRADDRKAAFLVPPSNRDPPTPAARRPWRLMPRKDVRTSAIIARNAALRRAIVAANSRNRRVCRSSSRVTIADRRLLAFCRGHSPDELPQGDDRSSRSSPGGGIADVETVAVADSDDDEMQLLTDIWSYLNQGPCHSLTDTKAQTCHTTTVTLFIIPSTYRHGKETSL
jgi:hypothetical protein